MAVTLKNPTLLNFTCATLALGVLAAAPAVAAPPSSDDADIVVTASRIPQRRAEVGSSVSVIDAQTIERRQYRFALDAVNALPGLSINQSGAYGGVASVGLRGVKPEQTLVLIDGIVVNDPSAPSAGFDFSRLDLEDVERIEVLRGPQSTLYGSDAMGGVVSLLTKAPVPGISGHVYGEGGSFGTARGGGTLNAGLGRASLRASLTGVRSNGISKADKRSGNSETDPYRALTGSAQGRVTLSDEIRIDGFVRDMDSRTDYDTIDFGTGAPIDGDQQAEDQELLAVGRLRANLFSGRFENTLSVSHTKITRDNFSGGLPSFSAEGVRDGFEYQGHLKATDRVDFVFGAKHERTKLRTDFDRNEATINSVYGLAQASPLKGLSLSAGARFDDHDRFGGKTTARFTGAYEVASLGTVIRASWGQGFKAPTPYQLTAFFFPATAPNLLLRPETNEGWDAGVEQPLFDGRLSLRATYFYLRATDLIDFSFVESRYVNVRSARSRGVEIETEAKLASWLDLGGNFTFTEAVDKTSGLPLVRVPRGEAKLFVTMTPTERLDVTVSVHYKGAQTDSFGPLAPWTRVDLAGGYKITPHVEVFGRIENLFDVHYQEVFGYGTPGLSAYGGVKLRS